MAKKAVTKPSKATKATKSVLIVESPAKGKTIEGYLGKGYKVVASYGHVRDLPKSKLGIDVEHDFEPQYMVPRGQASKIKALNKATQGADIVYLATDLDREGEAIAWHLAQTLDLKPEQQVKRITFSEITKPALQDAVAHPRDINQDLVDAQQARRVLDRLVGYSLSPVLWKKVRYGLSAGRVQSVALKFITDREKEIEAFQAEEYWTVDIDLSAAQGDFVARLAEIAGEKADLKNEKDSMAVVTDLKGATYVVDVVEKKPMKKHPLAPFTTSTLQQDAYRRLGFAARRTMRAAQGLYEAGLISYMRTDSVSLSVQALSAIRNTLVDSYGKQYALEKPRPFKTKSRGAQEAHEAIRPTNPELNPDRVQRQNTDETKLYRLIWQRALASQMPEAEFEQTSIKITAKGDREYGVRASGRVMKFDGFMKVYPMQSKEDAPILPDIKDGETLALKDVRGDQHFTQPPARYSEATLVKKLEEAGIGRPSTYAPTIATIISRGYVLSEDKRLVPQPTGMVVSELLSEHFDFVTDPEFTAEMEDHLDDVAEGKRAWKPVIKEYYEPMHKLIEEKQESIPRAQLPVIETDEKCDLCGKMMVIKQGRFGQFLACSGWPDCKNAKPILKKTGIDCPDCREGELVERKTKKGRRFWGCSRYPDCEYTTWTKPKSDANESDS
ncbi:type I DNA topoisomerase [bacterium]|nr:type I DNA topoisomerase [bacterium]